MEEIDVARVRAGTPGCNEILRFNIEGASPPPEPSHRVVLAHLELERKIDWL